MDSNNFSVLWGIAGPGISGAVFGAGWWFWVDAVVCSSVKISFLHYLPGIFASLAALMFNSFVSTIEKTYCFMCRIFASLAALMFNCVNRDEISYDYYSPYGGDDEWRLKLWLFVAYVVSFVSLAGAVGLLVQDALTDKGPSSWTGVAGVLQCFFILISGLVYWTCHTED